jgi:PPK2 family polyphosphate:nucleotide phosphotransferase
MADKKFDIRDLDTGYTGSKLDKQKGRELLADKIKELAELQNRFYADGRRGLLIILQALDAAGKDSTVRKVFSGINPQGVVVNSFKAPTHEELRHDYLWRCLKQLPEQGKWAIFNRSYYEEVLAVKVHPEYLAAQNLPPESIGDAIWDQRYVDINNLEKYLTRNGIIVLKFFLNVSEKEQAKRFLERAEEAEKNWKIGIYDMKERDLRPAYMEAINEMVRSTDTEHAPWNIIPADDKWYTHLLVADAIMDTLKKYDINYPKPDKAQLAAIREVKEILEMNIKKME